MVDADAINSWDDYWKIFEDLCYSLKTQGQTKIVEELFFARLHANGLTDGSYDFLLKFKNVYERNAANFQPEDIENYKVLVSILETSLNRR